MTFQYPDLQRCYESALALNIGGETDAERSVFALIATYEEFRFIEDDQPAKIQEIISHLLSSELRPALRSWNRTHFPGNNETAFYEIRDHLSKLAGESFG
jgi:hypothetical protein